MTVDDHERMLERVENEETYHTSPTSTITVDSVSYLPSRPSTIVLTKDDDLEDIGLWSETGKEGVQGALGRGCDS